MNSKHPTPPALGFAIALRGGGGAPPPETATPAEVTLTCEAFQAPRDGRCVYALSEEQQCMDGQEAACTVAGHAYLSGDAVAADEPHAAELYDRACRGDDAEGCASLAELREQGRGGPEDVAEAARLYSLSCELGDGQACANFGIMLGEGRGVEQDIPRAASLLERACAEGAMDGCVYLAMAYAAGNGVARDAAHALELYTRACDANSGIACNNLASLYEFDVAIPVDTARAMQLYERSCSLGEPWGCFNLARTHGEGNIVPPDLELARSELRAACEQGAGPACRLAQSLDAPAPTAEQTASSCTQPTALTLGREVTGTTEGATNGLTASCGLTAASPERVYTLRVTRPTRVKLDLFSSFDGVLHVRSACSVDPATQLACNDDVRGDAAAGGERHSALEVDLPRGTYFVVVDGYGASVSGTYRLLVDRVAAP